MLLLLVSFIDVYAGLAGLISVFTSNILAKILGFNRINILKGAYGFNSLLVGLGIGLTYTPGLETLIVVIIASITTLLITIALEGILGKYYLPFLSIPFILGIWIILLAGRDLSALGLSQRGIYTTNEIYQLGGRKLTDFYIWIQNFDKPFFIKTYFLSLGAIFFQYNIIAGILIAAGLLYHSRISFILSLLGFATAFVFYKILGVNITQYGYTYIGFNYILTAIAIGGIFLVPNKYSFLSILFLLPIVVLITLSTSRLLAPYQLPVYSLPFNIIVLLFLYFLKLRTGKHKYLIEIVTQLNSPEKNLYFYNQAKSRFKWLEFFPVSLPFMGEWTVSQGEEGEYTHQGDWRYAWDFVILNNKGEQYSGSGNKLTDYYCYEKNVISPAAGVVVEINDGIDDNKIGNVNLIQNWGNSIVIKHTEYLYSQISHLKKGTFKVKKGDRIKKGDILAKCGNSGRSPFPHLHFQLQATPYVGSKTIDYPVDHYVKRLNNDFELHQYSKPKENETVSNIKTTELLKRVLNFIPGKKLKCTMNDIEETWTVNTDLLNNTYIYSEKTNSYAYLYNDGFIHYFKSFSGNKNSALFFFFIALYQVPAGFYKDMTVIDKLPPDITSNKPVKIINDFFAPFYSLINVDYIIKFKDINNELMPDYITMETQITERFLNKNINNLRFEITVEESGKITVKSNSVKLEVKL